MNNLNLDDIKIGDMIKDFKISSGEKKEIYSSLEKMNDYLIYLCKCDLSIKNEKKSKKYFQEEFNNMQDKMVLSIHSLENKISSNIVKRKLRELFRNLSARYIYQSEILKHAYEKPRGYPGDYFLFETAYNNKPISEGIGYYLDGWILQHSLTKGIRYRKDRMKELLNESVETDNNRYKVINMGCGSARELREFLTDNQKKDIEASFVCFDQDIEPLNFCRNSLLKINNSQKVSLLLKDVLEMLSLKKENIKLEPVDLIYSMGIVDYFMKTTLEYFIRSCYNLLKRGGKLIIPFCCSYDSTLYTHLRWFCEWNFYSYDANFIKDFIKRELHIKNTEVIWEQKQPIFFVIIKK